MKKFSKILLLVACMALIPLVFMFTGCFEGNAQQSSENNETVEATKTAYTIDYDKKYEILFDDLSNKTVNKEEWVASLPKVNEEYKSYFLGWYIKNSNVKIDVCDYISANVTLEARFSEDISGLYQNGKLVKTWATLKQEYPMGISDTHIYSPIAVSYSNRDFQWNLNGDLIIDSSIISIDDYSLIETGLTSVIIPDSVTYIGECAFYSCQQLTRVKLSNNITAVSSYLFRYCNKLTSIEIPNNVTSIESCAFEGCSSLKDVKLSNSLVTIGSGAFADCSSLNAITLPDSLTTIEESAFIRCSSLSRINIPANVSNNVACFLACNNLNIVMIDSAIIANSINHASNTMIKSGSFTQIYIKTGLDVSSSNYLQSNYTKQLSSNRVGYDLWIKNN